MWQWIISVFFVPIKYAWNNIIWHEFYGVPLIGIAFLIILGSLVVRLVIIPITQGGFVNWHTPRVNTSWFKRGNSRPEKTPDKIERHYDVSDSWGW